MERRPSQSPWIHDRQLLTRESRQNGIKTLLQYNPWNTLKTYEAILNELGADIICFQETKITRKQVDRGMAVLPSYDSFFSSYSRKPEKGYSGTCIFTKRSTTVPLKAEEGLSGMLPLDRKPAPSQDELIEGALSSASIALNMQDVKVIDLEGRTTMIDLGLFVLINLYCPNETNEERLDFKLAFNAMLEARILNLIKAGRQVVAVGDMNICSKPIDHCDPVKRASESPYGGFEHHPARKWFNEFIGPKGSMVDLGRHFYPDRKSMFTHWETRINARETNYGTRIDYILATPGLLPWIKTCEICPHIIGSDHCPVIADFHESITTESGEVLYLWDHINPPGRSKEEGAAPPDPPKLAAKFYPEFGAEQRLLSNFFGKKGLSQTPPPTADKGKGKSNGITVQAGPSSSKSAVATPSASAPLPASLASEAAASSASQPIINTALEASSSAAIVAAPPESPSIDLTLNDSDTASDSEDKKPNIQKARSSSLAGPSSSAAVETKFAKKKAKNGQQTLAGFFMPPPAKPKAKKVDKEKKEKSNKSKKGKGKAKEEDADDSVETRQRETTHVLTDDGDSPEILEDESIVALQDKAQSGSRAVSSSPKKGKKRKDSPSDNSGADDEELIRRDVESASMGNGQASSAWSSIFTAKVPPLCTMHGEPCKQWTVNKSGLNKGRVFWLCNRPVGEGYERSGQKKEDVNPEFRCNFFKWESDIKRQAPVAPASKKKKLTPGHG